MASKSTLDPANFPTGSRPAGSPIGHDIRSLGPGDSSDSGSDLAGSSLGEEYPIVGSEATDHDRDIDTDRVITANEAGLGLSEADDYAPGSDAAADDRHRRIAEAAYYRAQRRGFRPGYEDEDWLEAEREIDRE